jgi:hypothetical protein
VEGGCGDGPVQARGRGSGCPRRRRGTRGQEAGGGPADDPSKARRRRSMRTIATSGNLQQYRQTPQTSLKILSLTVTQLLTQLWSTLVHRMSQLSPLETVSDSGILTTTVSHVFDSDGFLSHLTVIMFNPRYQSLLPSPSQSLPSLSPTRCATGLITGILLSPN